MRRLGKGVYKLLLMNSLNYPVYPSGLRSPSWRTNQPYLCHQITIKQHKVQYKQLIDYYYQILKHNVLDQNDKPTTPGMILDTHQCLKTQSTNRIQQHQNKLLFNRQIQIEFQQYMANNQEDTQPIVQTPQPPNTERIFMYVNIALLLMVAYCIPGFLAFRQLSNRQGYRSFKLQSLRWSIVGFFAIFAVKYTYKYLMRTWIQSIIHPKYQGAQREYKTKAVLKLSFDTIFYSLTTIFAYSLFKNEYWFPSMLGGQGSCSNLYLEYPNWPTGSVENLQLYYMLQLGVHAFSVFQMIVIRRGTERKYQQFLLHHCVAVNLLLFSMMCNQTAAGAMILIAHDLSDILAAFGRGFVETKYQIKWFNIATYIAMSFVWIYTRHIVYPFCLLLNVIRNTPTLTDEWYIIQFEYLYLCAMAVVLECMHVFWTYFLLQFGLREVKWKNMTNNHDEKSLNKLQ